MRLRSLLRCMLGSSLLQGAASERLPATAEASGLLQMAKATIQRSFVTPGQNKDPCPTVVEAYNHSRLSGLTVPYRLARTNYGLGVFALRKVRKGEVVWRYNPKEMVRLTETNWRQVTERLIRQRSWQDAPELDEAFERLAIQGRAAGDVPEEMLSLYLRKVQNYLVKYWSKDGETDYLLLLVGDSNYFNYAEMAADEGNTSLLQLSGFGTGIADAEPPEASLIDKEPMVAQRDVQPCTELLEDYAWSGDGRSLPEWMMQVLREHGGVTSDIENGFDDTSGRTASIG